MSRATLRRLGWLHYNGLFLSMPSLIYTAIDSAVHSIVLPGAGSGLQDSPHFQMAPKVSAKTGGSTS